MLTLKWNLYSTASFSQGLGIIVGEGAEKNVKAGGSMYTKIGLLDKVQQLHQESRLFTAANAKPV